MEATIRDEGVRPAKRRGRLDSLPTRQRTTGEQAAQRTILVRRLRIALPAIALVLIGGLLLNTRDTGGDDAFLDDFANLEATPEELKMASPRFAGVDDKGFPYEVTAEAALQSPNMQEVVELVKPKAVTKGMDENTVVYADKGVFQSEAKVLELTERVTLQHQIGADTYNLRTNAATVSIDDETVHSKGAIEGEGEGGSLRADSMRAYNDQGRVVFEGNVSMRIYPAKAKMKKGPEGESGEPQ